MMGAVLLAVAAVAVFTTSTAGALRGVEPFATWYYPLAWYPTLLVAEALVRVRTGRWSLFARPGALVAALAWSVPFWLLFELLNFRLANWYYVLVPDGAVERWVGITVSFATVLPAILLGQALAQAFGAAEGARWPALPVRRALPGALQLAGLGFFVLALVWPRVFFPLIWGGVTLLVDPWVYRRAPERSLLGALERGRPALILRILLGGLAIGLLWESYNIVARGHWIYTVPGLEEVKLFEMPVPGFLGFPVLALDGWAAWNALVLLGLAPEAAAPTRVEGRDEAGGMPDPHLQPLRTRLLYALSIPVVVACALVLRGMERWTIDSVTPRLPEVVGPAATPLSDAGYDVFSLARTTPDSAARAVGVPEHEAATWVRRARLTTLRGIGAENARRLERAGIESVPELADADPASLARTLDADGPTTVLPARVRVWVRGAQGQR